MADAAMLSDPLALAQLLCTRLCHDLAGPIGAVAAGVELTAGDPSQVDAETLGLIGNSSAAASRKLKFLRAALGVPAAHAGAVGDLRSLVAGFLEATAGRGGPAALRWPSDAAVAALAARHGDLAPQLVLNLCLLAHEAQPACRTLTLSLGDGEAAIRVSAEGEAARAAAWRPDIAAAIAGEGVANAKTVHAHFLHKLATRARGRLALAADGAILRATFAAP
jgi:histidine phosphotransferase ChpT